MPKAMPEIARWLESHPSVRSVSLHPRDSSVIFIVPTNRRAQDAAELQKSLHEKFGVPSTLTQGPFRLRIESRDAPGQARNLRYFLLEEQKRAELLEATRNLLEGLKPHLDPEKLKAFREHVHERLEP